MSLAQRIKLKKQQELAAAADEAREAEVARAKEAANTPIPRSIFDAAPVATAPVLAATQSGGSLAARIRQAGLARAAIENATAAEFAPERPQDGHEATEYELLLASLGADMARLKGIQSTEGKIAAKREMIEAYTPHVDASLAAAAETGQAVQDEVLGNMMIWRFDIGDWDRGLDIAEHVLRYRLRPPERFQRDAATIIAEEVAEAALTATKANKDFPLEALLRVSGLTADFDMPDKVRAKLEKAMGLQLVRAAEAADQEPDIAPAGAAHSARRSALVAFRRAIELEPKIGVAKDIERLEAWLRKHPASADAATENDQA